jgi:Bacterial PH domain
MTDVEVTRMGYVEQHLERDERVVYRGVLHPIVYVGPALVALIGVALLLWSMSAKNGVATMGSLILFTPIVLRAFEVRQAEFAVTSKRVIMKYGIIQRHSLELLLQKIEGAKVEQDIVGRLLGYGTLVVNGTGGTHEPFRNMAAPLEFRRHVLSQISMRDDGHDRATAPGPASTGIADRPRAERECPHCAELILERAKACKHCGRDVAPAA